MPHRTLAKIAVPFVLIVSGCDKPTVDKSIPSPQAEQSHSTPSPSASEKPAAASAAPTASAAPENASDKALVGAWEGRYDAKKASVEMPPRVQDKVRSKDDGKMAIGAGNISITINESLEVQGKTDGALGAASLRGKVEKDELRLQFFPTDPLDKHAMFGMVSGVRKDDRIDARIRVASGDVTVVREADVVLRRKTPAPN